MKIVTLTSDFGLSDPYVGQMKGKILEETRNVHLIDITHLIPPQNIALAQFVTSNNWKHFPKNTIHVVVVDPGVGTTRERIIVKSHGHYFVGPNNGTLGFCMEDQKAQFWKVKKEVRRGQSRTFEARDVFAPVAALLAKGRSPDSLGTRLRKIDRLRMPHPRFSKKEAKGEILAIDHFGNLITNLPQKALGSRDVVYLGGKKIGRIRDSYANVKKGQSLALINSYDLLEIAVREGSARSRFGAKEGSLVRVKFRVPSNS